MTEKPQQPSGRSTIRTVALIAKTRLPEAAAVITDITRWLSARGVGTVFEAETARLAGRGDTNTFPRTAPPTDSDLILVLGGDGTLLEAARGVGNVGADTPILAVNFGSLGFLTEVTLPELYESLQSVLDGTAGIDQRGMLLARVERDGQVIEEQVVLNDVVIEKAALSIIEITITVGHQLVTRLRADGLIVASPTGSTAYSMAAGGPIVHPLVDALLLTPIAPHTLTHRPIVIPSTFAVRITPTLTGAHQAARASFDGQTRLELAHGDEVVIERAARSLNVIRAEARNYFAVLREKLKWGNQ